MKKSAAQDAWTASLPRAGQRRERWRWFDYLNSPRFFARIQNVGWHGGTDQGEHRGL